MARATTTRRALGTLCLGASVITAAVVASAAGVVEAAGAPYTVAIKDGSFEQQVIASAGQYAPSPTLSGWTFGETAGLTRTNSAYTNGVPTNPDGQNSAYLQNIGKFSQRVRVEPGDTIVFRATQRVNANSNLHTFNVRIDGVVAGTYTPSRGSWGTFNVPVSVSTPGVVTLEFIGQRLSGDRTAIIDAVSISRPAVDIPDQGLSEREQVGLLETKTRRLNFGVVGVLKTGDSETDLDTPVQAFAEWRNPATGKGVIFVGGKFSQVENAATKARTTQSYLAAFDRDTGEWINTFRPVLNGTVWDLAVTDDGKLIVGGQFTNVNSVAYTAGVAALNPLTGAVIPGWRASLQLTGSGTRPFARAVKVVGDSIYIGGLFSRVVSGPNATVSSAGNIEKISAVDGVPVAGFSPAINGQVYDIDAANGRVYAVGYFSRVNNQAWTSEAILDWTTGAVVPGMRQMTVTSTSRPYQQAVKIVGDEVWVGGSEHSTQGFTWADNSRIRSFVTDPNGDTQAITELDGYLYYGNHARPGGFVYTDATTWPGVANWTTRDAGKWIMAVHIASRTVVPMWVPRVGTASGEGGWELFVDSTKCMWAGGDFDRGSSTGSGLMYVQGFTKFCQVDTNAPTRPIGLTALTAPGAGVSLQWLGSTDDRVGRVRYEILRNDRPIASGLTALTFTDPSGTANDRYFVRAIDVAGNMSATTPVAIVGVDNLPPTLPGAFAARTDGDAAVALSWNASSDNVGVAAYRVYRKGVEVWSGTERSVRLTAQPVGSQTYQVAAVDARGNESRRTASIALTVTGSDVDAPTVPRDLVGSPGADNQVILSWTGSTDNIGVTGYRVYRNGDLLTTTSTTSLTWGGLPSGAGNFQVSAVDAAGNESTKTASVTVVVAGADADKPSVPTDVTAVAGADGEAIVSWTASTDNVGVTGYRVYRSGVSGVLVTDVMSTTATFTGLVTGSNSFQISALDAAGNESTKTAAVSMVVTGPDVTKPSAPTGVTGSPGADNEAVVSWTAARDNIGVTGYRVYRSGVLVAEVNSTSATITGLTITGPNSFQVSALDAAGNESNKTASVTVIVTGADVTKPSIPKDPAATVQPNNDVVLTWTASTDNIGVVGYEVFQGPTKIATTSDLTYTVTGLGSGTYSFQVRAIDAAGNSSSKTAQFAAVIP